LISFAEGKHLGQLAGVVHDPVDALCDACGSTMARKLFGLKDTMTDRFYFVGQSCLGSLKAHGLVARRRYRQTAQVAHRQEMDRRKNGDSASGDETPAGPGADGNKPRRTADLAGFRRTIVISETVTHYETTVCLENGRRRYRGRAQVPRWRQDWAREDGGVVLLEPVLRDRRDAAFASLLQAYRKARADWRDGEHDRDREEHEEIVA
jgi:hypothetical protein